MIRFRPLLKPTLWCVPAFALLMGLGVWQVHRLHWKLGLIAQVHHNLSAPPLPLSRLLTLPLDEAQYHRVRLTGHYMNGKEAYVFATGPEGAQGYHVLTPFVAIGGKTLIVDRGFVPKALRDPAARPKSLLQGIRNVVGVWRTPDPPNLFTPAPDLQHRVWFSRNISEMAKTDHVTLAAPVVVEAEATPVPGGWPKGGQTVIDFPNNHLQYAITWFALAAGLLVIYLAYHRAQGRLSVR